MQEEFPGYFSLEEKEFKDLWKKALFVIDANVLLNLYRYSPKASEELLKVLEHFKGRLWMPHQAAFEYLNRRTDVIAEQEELYSKALKDVRALEEDLDNSRKHPFVSEKCKKDVKAVFENLKQELESYTKTKTDKIVNDPIQRKISELLRGRVGKKYDDNKLNEFFTQATVRYKQKIPPGYEDSKKPLPEDSFSSHRYGDYLVWRQIIDKAKESNQDIILVTDDKKEDWWKITRGNTIGPRPELIQEFSEETRKRFYAYQVDKFIEYANEELTRPVSAATIQEIKEFTPPRSVSGSLSGIERTLESAEDGIRILHIFEEISKATGIEIVPRVDLVAEAIARRMDPGLIRRAIRLLREHDVLIRVRPGFYKLNERFKRK